MSTKFSVTRFTFEELSTEAKMKAIKRQVERLQLEDFSDCITEVLESEIDEVLGDAGNNLKLHYSLSYSQGDGVALYGEIRRPTLQEDIDELPFTWPSSKDGKMVDVISLSERGTGNYHHWNSFNVELFNEEQEYSECLPDEHVTEFFRDFCRKLERLGYEELESHQSEAHAKEILSDHDEACYTENGTFDPVQDGVALAEYGQVT